MREGFVGSEPAISSFLSSGGGESGDIVAAVTGTSTSDPYGQSIRVDQSSPECGTGAEVFNSGGDNKSPTSALPCSNPRRYEQMTFFSNCPPTESYYAPEESSTQYEDLSQDTYKNERQRKYKRPKKKKKEPTIDSNGCIEDPYIGSTSSEGRLSPCIQSRPNIVKTNLGK